MKNSRIIVVTCALAAGPLAGSALAESAYLTAFQSRYPGSTLAARMATATGSQCNVCHHPTSRSNPGNCYKDALTLRLIAGRTIAQALADVETMDSDNDGVNNVTEILAVRTDLPGQVGYSPGLIGATGTDPCGAVGAVTNQRETPLASCYANCDASTSAPVLNVLDFSCFLNKFAAGESYANCDGSTNVPVLNVLDFSCFLNQFAAGCP